MTRHSLVTTFVLILATHSVSFGQGMLIPIERGIQACTISKHHVSVNITDQVAATQVEQVFHNHHSRPLEATYFFPVPRGASVSKFSMTIDGKEMAGELLDSKKAAQIYTDIVRRIQDPGLLEYLGNDLFKLRIFPVPAHGDVRIKLGFTSIVSQEGGINEYIYPVKTNQRSATPTKDISFRVTMQCQQAIQTIYSPTHSIATRRLGENKAEIDVEKSISDGDRDFQLFYGMSSKDLSMHSLMYRPVGSEPGYAMLVLNPSMDAAKVARTPRDLVLVLDTSGSMSDQKMDQAKKALRFCLSNLDEKDRFGLLAFSTTVNPFRDELKPASGDILDAGKKWIDDLRAGGGTAILPALEAALKIRPGDSTRPLTIIFFTDGVPTIDETNPQTIVKKVIEKNNTGTRIFTFGVGDDVNAAMLDQLAEATRATSVYVRPKEDLEIKASALYTKISHPVMTDLKLTSTNFSLVDVYPSKLPDLFHGQQLIVLGRFHNDGATAIKLTGKVNGVDKEIVHELTFPTKTDSSKRFVEELWARRKVGYLLDQIRINGESKEVIAEVVSLAKKFGIVTPYTSYLVVPDGVMPGYRGRDVSLASPEQFGAVGERARKQLENVPRVGFPTGGAGGPAMAPAPGGVASARGGIEDKKLDEQLKGEKDESKLSKLKEAKDQKSQLESAAKNYRDNNLNANQQGRLGVDLAIASNELKVQDRVTRNVASRIANGRSCIEVGGIWIDDKFEAKLKIVTVKAQSDAYFKILEKQPSMKDVFMLGNYVIWITPSNVALAIDQNHGQESMTDDEIATLFKK